MSPARELRPKADPAGELLLPGEDLEPSRRAFLKWSGFGIASAVLSGCSRGPVRRAIPFLQAPEEIVPGRAYHVASTCQACPAACGVLAKCRDGRPIKLEGNELDPLGRGGLCAVGQSSVLSLYDSQRLDGPLRDGAPTTWREADDEVRALLGQIRARGGKVRLLTGTIHSPSALAAIESFLAGLPDARHVMADPLSASAVLDANERTRGVRVLPRVRFERARVIASFEADFLGTWIAPVEHAAGYAAGRAPDATPPRMSRHWQLEARLSLTGCAADQRVCLAPWEQMPALAELCELLALHAGQRPLVDGDSMNAPAVAAIQRLSRELWEARGESVVVCGLDDVHAQILVCYANELLGSYGTTLDVERPSLQRRGDDRALADLAFELGSGQVELLIVAGLNPAYTWPASAGGPDLGRAGALVALSPALDETAALARWILPEPHFLERWDDSEPVRGRFGLTQPTVPPLRSARTLRATLAGWMGDERDDRELLREHWRERLYPLAGGGGTFEAFFDRALHDGVVELSLEPLSTGAFDGSALAVPPSRAPAGELGLVRYPKVALLDGAHAHNPWLQELPDPVSKIAWDNYACLSPARARELGVAEGDVVRVASGDATIELPAHVQPGQHDGVVCVALGYGRAGTERFAQVGPRWLQGRDTVAAGGTVGVNVAPLGLATWVTLERTGRRVDLASTQDHHRLEVPAHLAPKGGEVRDAVRSVTLADWVADPAHALHGGHGGGGGSLWSDDHPIEGRHWGMVIDLARCTGCSACVIGCQAENNVPVVGKDEVRRHREMHWLRIDRYYQGEEAQAGAAYQPMLCQQCDNAPCESVCPVLATVHSAEGLNQQVYNRCVGTRYCANTCPYKVRRFNWFDYARDDELANNALNPDVTVRTRGVMEKCSFCVQRIAEAKAEARRRGVPLADGDVKVACQQSCPTKAIRFGDLADPASEVARAAAGRRAYGVLEELNVRPSVRYLARVRNRESGEEERRG